MWYVPACERQRRDVIFYEFVIRIKTGGFHEDETQMTCTVVVMFQQVSIVPTESMYTACSVSQETRYCRCAKHAFLEIILFPITHLHPLCTLQEETSAN